MGISAAFLNELNAQRASAIRDLGQARLAGDDGATADAIARIEDLDELLCRNGSNDVVIDLDAAASLTRTG